MKRFIKKLILFLFLFGIILLGLDVCSAQDGFREVFAMLTDSGDYRAGKTDEVEEYITQVREKGSYTKLLVGDSVCYQLTSGLREQNEDYCLAGNNRALTLAGEYLLIQEFLRTHENVTDVYLMVGLDALQTQIDTTYGYPYVVIPFTRAGLLQNLDDATISDMKETFGGFFLQPAVVKLIAESSMNRKIYFNYLKDYRMEKKRTDDGGMSELAADYLEKIYELCGQEGVTLHLLPDPLADNKGRHEQEEKLRQDFVERGFDRLFPDYFDGIRYYPQDQFVDGIHFGSPYDTQEAYNEKLRELYLDRGYLEGLVLDEKKS